HSRGGVGEVYDFIPWRCRTTSGRAADAHNFGCGTVLARDLGTMRRPLALIVVLFGLLVMLPFAWASTYEAWTDGFYDAELNDDALALLSLQAVISDVALTEGLGIEIVAVMRLADDTGGDLADPSARSARAPPAS